MQDSNSGLNPQHLHQIFMEIFNGVTFPAFLPSGELGSMEDTKTCLSPKVIRNILSDWYVWQSQCKCKVMVFFVSDLVYRQLKKKFQIYIEYWQPPWNEYVYYSFPRWSFLRKIAFNNMCKFFGFKKISYYYLVFKGGGGGERQREGQETI